MTAAARTPRPITSPITSAVRPAPRSMTSSQSPPTSVPSTPARQLGRRPYPSGRDVELPTADMGESLGAVEQFPASPHFLDQPPHPVELEVRAHAGQQFAGREGLHQIVVGAGLQPFDGRVITG